MPVCVIDQISRTEKLRILWLNGDVIAIQKRIGKAVGIVFRILFNFFGDKLHFELRLTDLYRNDFQAQTGIAGISKSLVDIAEGLLR